MGLKGTKVLFEGLKKTLVDKEEKLRQAKPVFRAFLSLWFAKPMVCMRVVFHEKEGNHANDENDEDSSDSW